MSRALWIATMIAITGCGAASSHPAALPYHASTRKQPQMFPHPGPIATADPDRRSARTVRLPSRLRVRSGDGARILSWDPASVRDVQISVGRDMVLGAEIETTVWRGSTRVPGYETLEMSGIDDALQLGSESYLRPPPGHGERAVVVLRVFETDIPTQHGWSPRSGRFRVLHEETIELPL